MLKRLQLNGWATAFSQDRSTADSTISYHILQTAAFSKSAAWKGKFSKSGPDPHGDGTKCFKAVLDLFFFFFFKDTCLFLYVALTYTYKEKQHEIQNLQYLVDLFDLLVKALSRDMMCWA